MWACADAAQLAPVGDMLICACVVIVYRRRALAVMQAAMLESGSTIWRAASVPSPRWWMAGLQSNAVWRVAARGVCSWCRVACVL